MKVTVMKVTVNNEALAEVLGVQPGSQVEVKCKNGIPVERYWRNRFRDAKIDKCISLPAEKSTKKIEQKEETE